MIIMKSVQSLLFFTIHDTEISRDLTIFLKFLFQRKYFLKNLQF